MPIEAGTTIADLDQSWPLSGDNIVEGDNHIRLIKAILKAQFPGANSNGFDVPITATEAEINYLSGLTGNIQAQLDALSAGYQANLFAPSGTVMVFYQAAPPLGWTQQASNNDSMLRVVSTAGGGAGGTDSPTNFDLSHVHATQGHTLTTAEMPIHSHSILRNSARTDFIRTADNPIAAYYNDGGSGARYVTASVAGAEADVGKSSSTGGSAAHDHGNTASGGGTFTPKYINVITAVKD